MILLRDLVRVRAFEFKTDWFDEFSAMNIDSLTTQITLGLISFTANFLSALAGGGAGLLQLPALILLGLPFQIALATHKTASVALGLGAAFRYLKGSSLDKGFAALILIFGLPGVLLGAKIVIALPEELFNFLLGLLTLIIGLYSFNNQSLGIKKRVREKTSLELLLGGLVLFCIGILNGSLASGTGLFVTIWLVYWFEIDYALAVAYTLILVGLFWNGTGALVLGVRGDIAWDLLPILLIGSLLGGFLGSHYAISKGRWFIKRAFECLTLLVGLTLLTKAI
ncbi:sulfite exporter TauE/SafE family protein [Prochlorococcus sp. MIT 1341]|uniref:sulfite exporter TauE/SafE family protein n=1 Tax=Prochlorococcus sp. MIT 1341 TaxID=3096221 RepID=UPI002A75BFEE|nr:sulfite exporter TauE/SafE family protein [Prochlorococcus sp. MIT 1341]